MEEATMYATIVWTFTGTEINGPYETRGAALEAAKDTARDHEDATAQGGIFVLHGFEQI